MFDTWEVGGSFKVKKNPNYWKAGLPHLDSMEFKIIPDEGRPHGGALQSGDVNMVLTSTAAPANERRGLVHGGQGLDLRERLHHDQHRPRGRRQAEPPGRRARPQGTGVRHRSPGRGHAGRRRRDHPDVAVGPEQPVGHARRPERLRRFRPRQGQGRVRRSTRRPPGEPTLSFTLSGLPDVDGTRVLQLLQSQWKDVGIDAKIETLEQTAYITKAATGDYQAAFFRNYGYSDPDMNYYFWSSSTAKGVGNISINFTQFTTPALEADLTTGRQSGFAERPQAGLRRPAPVS